EPDLWDYPLGIEVPPGFQAGNTTDVTAFVSGTTYARYIGRARRGLNQLDVLYQVTTAMTGGSPVGEIAVACSGDPELLPSAGTNTIELQLIQYLDTSGRYNSLGRKKSSIVDIADTLQGTHLWVLLWSQASTPAQFRGGLPDTINVGSMFAAAATRPSTMSGWVVFTGTANTFNDIWLGIKQLNA
ncbi:MAG: hypothetical protein IT477_10200, partial [Rhodanobacteraceae bacterium]|nr:hypothetical protein [Rhodanobacteraceae bacterium]